MSYDAYDVIVRESAAFVTAATHHLDADVPSCPDWQVRDLVKHLGSAHRFHALHLLRGIVDAPTDKPHIPDEDDGLLQWFQEGARALLGALQDRPPESPAWNWSAHSPKVASFWSRRMALETAIHRWDCEAAREDGSGFDLDLALDGIDEVLHVHKPADLTWAPPPEVSGIVHVRLTDSDASWTIAVSKDAFVVPDTQQTPDAVLEGTASGVFLALWGRVPLSSFEITGDETLVAAVRTG